MVQGAGKFQSQRSAHHYPDYGTPLTLFDTAQYISSLQLYYQIQL